jgi:hypothetical protein
VGGAPLVGRGRGGVKWEGIRVEEEQEEREGEDALRRNCC